MKGQTRQKEKGRVGGGKLVEKSKANVGLRFIFVVESKSYIRWAQKFKRRQCLTKIYNKQKFTIKQKRKRKQKQKQKRKEKKENKTKNSLLL